MGIARIDNLDGKEPIRNVLNTTAVGGAAGKNIFSIFLKFNKNNKL